MGPKKEEMTSLSDKLPSILSARLKSSVDFLPLAVQWALWKPDWAWNSTLLW